MSGNLECTGVDYKFAQCIVCGVVFEAAGLKEMVALYGARDVVRPVLMGLIGFYMYVGLRIHNLNLFTSYSN